MSIRHVVSFRLAAESETVRAEQARQIVERVKALKGVVPAIDAVSAGRGTTDGNWDLALVVDVADREALHAYATHPVHQELLAYVKSVMAERAAVDFEV